MIESACSSFSSHRESLAHTNIATDIATLSVTPITAAIAATLVTLTIVLALLMMALPTRADYLYGVNWNTDDTYIFTLDTDTGEMAKYYGHPVDDISALDFDSSGQLYALTTHALYRIDLYNPSNNEMIAYGADWVFESFEIIDDVGYTNHVFDGGLIALDLETGEDTLVGQVGGGANRLTGLASNDLFPPRRGGPLYAGRVFRDDIVTVDPVTAEITGTVAVIRETLVNLAYGSDHSLWFIDSSDSTLYRVDIATGIVSTFMKKLDLSNVTGLAAVPDAPALWPEIITTSLPPGEVGIPYGPVAIEVQGGEPPLQWILVPFAYEEIDLGASLYYWRGQAQGWFADNGAWEYWLPFHFPFYGETYRQVWITSNGYIDLAGPFSDPNNSDTALIAAKRICPLWDDLSTSYGGRDIYIDESADNEVTVFWNVYRPQNQIPCYFQCSLRANGEIEFHYGPRSEAVTPTVGISNGDSIHYELSMYNGQTDLEDVNSVRFTPQEMPDGLTFSADAVISGTPIEAGFFDLELRVIDSLLRDDEAILTLEILPGPSGLNPDDTPPNPTSVSLLPAKPNPFNPTVQIAFELPQPAPIELTIVDLRGEVVRRLLNGAQQQAGRRTITWDGCADDGRTLPSGTYLVRLRTGREVQVGKVMLVR